MLRVMIIGSGEAGGPFYTTLHFGGDTAGEATAAVDAVDNFYDALATNSTNTLTNLVLGDVERIDPATGQIIEVFGGTSQSTTGTLTGDILPPTSQALLRLRTGDYVAGRELRGRVFVTGWLESHSTGGQPNATLVTALNGAAAGLLSAASAAGGWGVYSPTHRVFSLITATQVWSQFAVLRSRRLNIT